MIFEDKLKEIFLKNGFVLSDEKIEKFKTFYELLLDWNQRFNLTTITSEEDVIIKHFLDSVIASDLLKDKSLIIDIGAGAGFPSIPLKIMNPSLKITLVDSVNKKVIFLNEIIEKLKLLNIEALHFRIEDLAKTQNYHESFDYVVARAVASLNTLCEYSLPFLKTGGTCVFYKAENIDEEITNSKNAIKVLGGELKEIKRYEFENLLRSVILIKKVHLTPSKYPRDKNKPRTNPL